MGENICNKNNKFGNDVSNQLSVYDFQFEFDDKSKNSGDKQTNKKRIDSSKKRKSNKENDSSVKVFLRELEKEKAAKLFRELKAKRALANHETNDEPSQLNKVQLELNQHTSDDEEFLPVAINKKNESLNKSIGSPWRADIMSDSHNRKYNYIPKVTTSPCTDSQLKQARNSKYKNKNSIEVFFSKMVNKSTKDESSEVSAKLSKTTSENNVDKEHEGLFDDPDDIQLIHFNEPIRKVYERQKDTKQKKMVYEITDKAETVVIEKKITKKPIKKKLTKKEERDLDKWSTSFNSSLQEAEEFQLDIE